MFSGQWYSFAECSTISIFDLHTVFGTRLPYLKKNPNYFILTSLSPVITSNQTSLSSQKFLCKIFRNVKSEHSHSREGIMGRKKISFL